MAAAAGATDTHANITGGGGGAGGQLWGMAAGENDSKGYKYYKKNQSIIESENYLKF
mgnify:CR=1 FL=1